MGILGCLMPTVFTPEGLKAGETWVRQTRTCMEMDDARFVLADSLTAVVWGAQGGANIRQGREERRRKEWASYRPGGLK